MLRPVDGMYDAVEIDILKFIEKMICAVMTGAVAGRNPVSDASYASQPSLYERPENIGMAIHGNLSA
jgi:hypothetical protein